MFLFLTVTPLATAAPQVSDGTVAPASWSRATSVAVTWYQADFGQGVNATAVIEVNASPDGLPAGAWEALGSLPAPLKTGPNGVLSLPVAAITGRHLVRLVINGVANSPLLLGTLQLDRDSPVAIGATSTGHRDSVRVRWEQSDDYSGTDPAEPLKVELNGDPGALSTGPWMPFDTQPSAGDGLKSATTDVTSVSEGRHLVRVTSQDRAGNSGGVSLGTVLVDRTGPTVTAVSLTRQVRHLGELADLSYRADDGAGSGVATVRVAPVGAGIDVDWSSPGAPGPGRVLVQAPGPGVYALTMRVADAYGNWGESAPVTVRFPTPAEAADAVLDPPIIATATTGSAPGPGVRWAVGQARRFARARGLDLRAQVRVARTAGQWRGILGPKARRFAGYSTLQGRILLGPAVTRSLEAVGGARTSPGRHALSRADVDGLVQGLAVLLHETMHETGPAARDDSLGTHSGRAFEEGFAEAAVRDLLRPFVAGLDVPPPLRAQVVSGTGRYRHAYRGQVAWALRMSALATHGSPGTERARRWRIRVADTWGADRWTRLAAATGRTEAALRAEAAASA